MRRMRNPPHDIQKVQKAYTSITTSDPVNPTLGCTYQKSTKLNYTEMIRFKNVI